jgi:hypothetical protein
MRAHNDNEMLLEGHNEVALVSTTRLSQMQGTNMNHFAVWDF